MSDHFHRRQSAPSFSVPSSQTSRITKPRIVASTAATQITRASKACSGCRRKKTRCFPSNSKVACSRCESLSLLCSFEEEAINDGQFTTIDEVRSYDKSRVPKSRGILQLFSPQSGLDYPNDKLESIHQDVKKILQYVMSNNPTASSLEDDSINMNNNFYESNSLDTLNDTINNNFNDLSQNNYETSMRDKNAITPLTMVPLSFLTSPFNVLKESHSSSMLPFPVTSLLEPSLTTVEKDIVTLGFISKAEAFSLLNIFREKYGKWISLPPTTSTEDLLSQYRKESPLLLDVACLVALRSSQNHSLRKKITKWLNQRIVNSLGKQLLNYPVSDLKFICTLALLSIYGYSMSLQELTIDPWYYSGLGLQHFITSVNYNPTFVNATISIPDAGSQYDLLTYMRIYDHLLVTHLFNCIVSGRTCSIDRIRLNKIRSKLDIVFAGTFDGKMTAEIYLCDTVYNFFVKHYDPAQYTYVQKELKKWYENWKYLIDQPIPQVLEYFYNFYKLLITYHVNFQLHFDKVGQLQHQHEMEGLDADANGDEDGDGNDGNNGDFNIFKQHCSFETLDSILKHTELHFLNSMLFNCLKVVNEILSFISKSNMDTIVDSSEQFEYFSDQIHFSLLFTITIFIRILNSLFINNNVCDNDGNANVNDMKKEYISYVQTNATPINIHGNLSPSILKTVHIQQKQPLYRLTKQDFLTYISEIAIIVAKYNVTANSNDAGNLFWRYAVTLEDCLRKAFPGIEAQKLVS